MTETPTSDITRLELDGREIILIGTAHISQNSVDTVREVIAAEQPDTVCIELDAQRFQALRDRNRWESLNLIQVVRKGQVPFLLANLALASFQKRMGLQTGVKPGAELAAAAETAEEHGIAVELIDRNIRTTLLRAWRKTGLWRKLQLLSTLLASLFEKQEINEEELDKLRETDTLSAMLEEMGDLLPNVKQILVDERDAYMAEKIRRAPGQKLVAVVGAAHAAGICSRIQQPADPQTFAELDVIPAKSMISKLIPWLIPGIVIALFIAGFFFGDRQAMADAAVAWVLVNGLLSAAGTILAFGHPLSVLAAFVAAPITSLNPTIGAGMVVGLVQAFIAAPTVRDLEHVGEDLANLRGWWRNRVTRVLLVFLFSSIGSAIGTLVAFHWLKDLIR
ncbi:TraB/GumN family protein [Geothermobacter hydrogeniphilus]|uniref:Conjugal transfer protein TraB n=1 Tax=Geothermobacter hydrogeniphilus TaxID=1969733 RepID=A0A1X0XK37_9BACT|nr:TraB/GumN family protein [Geothermobacter hydrogeniphilus]ORJ53254.1 conjugal transfer protein TraB [Geothermobacter hydrogeniphilus]